MILTIVKGGLVKNMEKSNQPISSGNSQIESESNQEVTQELQNLRYQNYLLQLKEDQTFRLLLMQELQLLRQEVTKVKEAIERASLVEEEMPEVPEATTVEAPKKSRWGK